MKQFFKNPFHRDRALGVSKTTRVYDLPLSGGAGNGFLRLLIALMSVLGILALSSSFGLSAMTKKWEEGLANKITIEIPATDEAGSMIPTHDIKIMTDAAAKILAAHKDVTKAEIMEENQIKDLLSPWLGNDLTLSTLPIPGIISVTMKKDSNPDLERLQTLIAEVAPRARIDTHQSWLSDVARFTGALQFSAILIGLIIGVTTLVAVAGGVRSKLSENKEELELLHLMGATDSYIAQQIGRHTMFLSLQGAAAGMIFGFILLFAIALFAGKMGFSLVPDFKLSFGQGLMLFLLPVPLSALAMITARMTVKNVLVKLP